MNRLQIKRVYDPPAAGDGLRVLVDRLWPRGLSKQEAQVDAWLKDAAPSAELRRWFGHDPARWAAFRERYTQEVRTSPALEELRKLVAGHKAVTLLFAARDEAHNNAVVLRGLLGGA